MNLYINHAFHYELENLTRLFYPNEKITVIKDSEVYEEPYIKALRSNNLFVEVKCGEFFENSSASLTDDVEDERMLCELLYKILCKLTGVTPPWGMITGVRPVKLYRNLFNIGGKVYADEYFKDKLFVNDEKLKLAQTTEKIEKRFIDLSRKDSFSLYIAIPFCPTRCHYCSFVQSSIERSKHLVEPYVGLLCEEIKKQLKIRQRFKKQDVIY